MSCDGLLSGCISAPHMIIIPPPNHQFMYPKVVIWAIIPTAHDETNCLQFASSCNKAATR